jgi:hypothetical protein
MEGISQSSQHSQAAVTRNRNVFFDAAHISEEKAPIWFKFCPDDSQTFKIMLYAIVPVEAMIHKMLFQPALYASMS